MVTDTDEVDREAFSRRLNEALDEIGVPPKGKGRQIRVGKMFGATQKGARKWLEGEAVPARPTMKKISRRTNWCEDYLLYGTGPKYITAVAESSSSYVPLESSALCRYPVLQWADLPDWRGAKPGEYKIVPRDNEVSPESFFLRVEGDAMASEFPAGGWILIDPNQPVESGDLVVAVPAGSSRPIFRELQIESGRKTLVPRNSRYPTEPCETVIGRVMEHTRRY